jgi:hypothetical protein
LASPNELALEGKPTISADQNVSNCVAILERAEVAQEEKRLRGEDFRLWIRLVRYSWRALEIASDDLLCGAEISQAESCPDSFHDEISKIRWNVAHDKCECKADDQSQSDSADCNSLPVLRKFAGWCCLALMREQAVTILLIQVSRMSSLEKPKMPSHSTGSTVNENQCQEEKKMENERHEPIAPLQYRFQSVNSA